MQTQVPAPRRAAFWLRSLRHHLLTIFLPLFLLMCAMIAIVGIILTQTQRLRVQERLHALNASVTEALDTSLWMGVNLANQRNIIPSLLAGDAKMQDELTQRLNSYRVSHSLFGDVIAYYRQVPQSLFTAKGVLDVQQLAPFFVLDTDVDTYPLVLDQVQKPTLLSATQGMHVVNSASGNYFHSDDLLYIAPVTLTTSAPPYVTIMTVLDRARLSFLAEQGTLSWPGAVFMLNAGERVVFASGSLPETVLDPLSPADITAETQVEGYDVFAEGNEGDAVRFVFLAEAAGLRAELLRTLTPLTICALLAIAMDLLLCVYLSLRAYWPIIRLNRLLRRGGDDPASLTAVEIARMEAVSSAIRSENAAIGHQLKHLTTSMQVTLLQRVLEGGVRGAQEIERLLRRAHLDLRGPLYVALSVHLQRDIPSERRYQLSFSLAQDIYWPYGIIPIVSVEDDAMLVFIASLPAGLGIEQYRELLLSVMRAALTDYDIEATLSISHVKQSLPELREAYLEAQSALMRSEGGSDDAPLPAAPVPEDLPDPHPLLTSVEQALRRNDFHGTKRALDAWFARVSEHRESADREQRRIVRLLDAVFAALIEAGHLTPHRAETLLSRGVSLPTLEETHSMIVGILDAIATHLPLSRAEDDLRLEKRMLDYMQAYMYDPLFSMTMMAEHFDLPVSAFARQFKRSFGQTFLGYVSQQRIERAKVLLVETDMLLKEIVAAIGYVDASNFIRKFKLGVGMTPGEYRKLHGRDA